ncbi:MAG: sugar phosphate nucleotidyltransferase [Ignavibacteria bacterium]|nr:sugar phosphate nucleotidyltransferase [Ignavibacteria bacterium]
MIKKAMILAAGFGTRLKPLTDHLPKALVPFGTGTMISYQIEKLKLLGINEIVVNAHHHSALIEKYFSENDFGIKINVIVEKDILGTGGGILNAEKFLKDGEYFLAVNVDVYTDLDISKMFIYNDSHKPFASLCVQKRNTSRYLVFDENMNLNSRIKTSVIDKDYFAFNGIHIISNYIFDLGLPVEYSDIIDLYMKVSADYGKKVKGFNAGDSLFDDIGKIESYTKYNKASGN